jgi:hypothetical protein
MDVVPILSGLPYKAPMSSVVPSCVSDIDASIARCYPGSGQTLYNIIQAPADGSASSAYNIQRGQSQSSGGDDPTPAGGVGTTGYFTFDGGDSMSIAALANTTFLESLHKTTGFTPFWIAVAFRPGDQASSGILWGTNTSSTALGMRLNIDSAETIKLFQGDGTTAKSTTNSLTTTVGEDYVIICSYDGATVSYWKNNTAINSAAFVYNTATGAAQTYLRTPNTMASGHQFYGVSFGNTYLTDSEAQLIIRMYRNRHQRSYGAA